MPSIDGLSGSDTQYVPAWKRLGLKLKFAQEVIPANNVEPTTKTNSQRPKRSRDRSDAGDILPSPKAARRGGDRSRLKIAAGAVADNVLSPSMASSATLELRSPPKISDTASTKKNSLETPTLTKRRSVTFTPDTKTQDGDSIKQLFQAWAAEQIADNATLKAEFHGETFQLESQSAPPNSLERTKPKKQKLPKDPAATQKTTASSSPHVHPGISYLLQHHQSPSNWKFNKSKQNFIIKHLFNLEQIPSSYNEALHGYISGLKGREVRKRIKEAAENIIKEEQEQELAPHKMDDPAARKRAYDEALGDHLAKYNAYKARENEKKALHRAEMSRRTDLVLAALADSIDPAQDEEPQADAERKKRTKLNDGSAKSSKRKRKQRTAAVDEEESSSSDETSDSDAEKPEESSSSSEDESSESDSSSSSSSPSSSGSESSSSAEDSSSSSSDSGSDDDDDDSS
ncbi:MAG: hypothetical protein M1829_002257 [Trizodia sp. TS-e1964]|nr:MAG: hypothetical protein M1829_002257 [Trizodia sp. TS-e1964]